MAARPRTLDRLLEAGFRLRPGELRPTVLMFLGCLATVCAFIVGRSIAAAAVASECNLARCARSSGPVSGRCCCGEGSTEPALRPACCESLRLEAAPALPDRPGQGAAPPSAVASSPRPQASPPLALSLRSGAPLGAPGTAPPLVILHRALLL